MSPHSLLVRALPVGVVSALLCGVVVANSQTATDADTTVEPAIVSETTIPVVADEHREKTPDSDADLGDGHSADDGHDHADGTVVARLGRTDVDLFSMVGVTWAKGSDDYLVKVSYRSDEGWSDPEELHVEGGDQGEGGRPGTEPLWVGEATGVAVTVESASGTTPQDMKIATIDPNGVPTTVNAAATVGQPSIVTRSQWGASAGTSCDKPGPRAATATKGAVIHHTAGSNSYTKAQSAGIVKSVQAYHTKSQKWCDIGYNFLVDRYGQIFEGRKGGIDKQVRAAHSGNGPVNEDTVGVSMMGTFEKNEPPTAMKNAVASLVAWRFSLAGLPATGTYSLGGKTLNRIAGHRNVVGTACPGAKAYAWLSAKGGLRDLVTDKLKNATPAPTFATPANLTSTAQGTSSLTLKWDAVADAPKYRIQLSTSSSMADAVYYRFTGTTATISDLKPGTKYYFRVRVIDPDGANLSPYTATPYPSASTTSAYPGGYSMPVPANLTSTGQTPSSLSLKWDAVPNAVKYRIQLSTSASMSSPVYYRFTDPKATITGLKPGTKYYFRVRVIDADGVNLSDYTAKEYPSASTTASYPGGYAQPVPANLTSTAQSTSSLTLDWADVAGAKSYRVQLSTKSTMASATYTTFTTSTGTISGLKPGTKYWYRVAVVDPTTAAKLSDYTQTPYPSSSTKTQTVAAASTTSAKNTITVPSSRKVAFKGHGYGHGIGMSQYGAQGAARDGKSWTQILSTYYPGTSRTTKSGDIRVLITADSTDSVMIEGKSGITFRQGSTKISLPTSIGGKKVVRWSIDPLSSDKKKSTLRYRTGTTYATYEKRTWTGNAQFEASTLELVLPKGGNKVYRDTLRSALPKSGATNRDTVNELSLENYTRGVVAREMPSSWHVEALKAQSVAARTYGARGITSSRHYDMCDTTSCQVYGGVSAETSATDAAVKGTAGTVLSYGGKLAFTQFSSSSGGHTNVGSQPYLKAVSDPYDGWSGNKNHSWTITVNASTIEKKYTNLGTLKSLTVTKRNGYGDMGGRVSSVKLTGSKGTKTISGVDARWAFGLRSDWFGF